MVEIKSNDTELGAKILVAGIGGCGNNAVNRMIDQGIQGVDFICMNTDKQQLNMCNTENVLQLGERITKGLGAGARPEIGEKAAEESQEEIAARLEPYDMVFVTCGMGGGTGTGAAPIVAKIAKDMNKLTVGVVTKPFFYEGNKRMQNAIKGIENIREVVDTLIVIPNDKIYEIMDSKNDYADGLRKADEVLQQSVQGITDLINTPSDINLDFADVQTAMKDKGIAHIGIGTGKGDDRAMEAVKMAVESPLLETKLDGATDIIVNMFGDIDIQGPRDAMQYILGITGSDVNVIIGVKSDKTEPGECKITVIATGIDDRKNAPAFGQRAGFQSGVRTNGFASTVTRTSASAVPPRTTFGTQAASQATRTAAPASGTSSAQQGQTPVRRDFQQKADIRSKVQEKSLNIPSFLQNK